jgi:hypothetical protein
VVAPPRWVSPGCGLPECQKPWGFVAVIVGDARLVAIVVGAGPSVAVCPKDISPDIAVAVCPWPIAASSAPRATTPLTAIAATRHLNCLLCISAPPFRSFAASPPTKRSCRIARNTHVAWGLLRRRWEATGNAGASEQSRMQWRGSLCSASASRCCSFGPGLADVAWSRPTSAAA